MSEVSNSNGNGNGGARAAASPHITIKMADANLFTLAISGEFPSIDYALNMLEQARRELEAQWRLQRAAAYQQQQVAMAEEARIRADLRRSH